MVRGVPPAGLSWARPVRLQPASITGNETSIDVELAVSAGGAHEDPDAAFRFPHASCPGSSSRYRTGVGDSYRHRQRSHRRRARRRADLRQQRRTRHPALYGQQQRRTVDRRCSSPGKYDLRITAPGFKTYEAKGVILRVAQKARVDTALQVGAANTEVTVEGSTVAQVETQSSDLSGVVTGKEISQLELNGRNFTQLVTLVPGVTNQSGQDEGTVGVSGNVAYSINGGRTEYNNWELDGGDNLDNGSNTSMNVYPSIEAIAEFKVLTSNYGAQYGRNGSGTVEVETKSGTNVFHGSAYEFLRNDAFNANNWFNAGNP